LDKRKGEIDVNQLTKTKNRMDYQATATQKLKDWFKRFADKECKGVSSLYFNLSNKIANDDKLIKIASFCKKRQPMPNLFLASIHYLLLNKPSEELSKYYPSITTDYKQDLPFEMFKEFCLRNAAEIIALEQSKIVQTNALNRSAYIMPILSNLFDSVKINLIDIGTSAGLTLNLDKYAYYYDNEYVTGEGLVKIRSAIKEGELPNFKQILTINNKIGIDQNPLDLKIKENADWLKALIWADKVERIEKIEQAIKIARQENIQFEKASSIDKFEEIIYSQKVDVPLVIYHTHTLYQFTQEKRNEFWNLIDNIGRKRDLIYLATENSQVLKNDYGVNGVVVELTKYQKGKKLSQIVAETNGHANWIKWK